MAKMSGGELFQIAGAFAGFVSLVWQIVTQLCGTYDSRTINQVLNRQMDMLNDLVVRIERLR